MLGERVTETGVGGERHPGAVSYTHLKQLAALLHIPGLYRLVPGVFVKSTRSVLGPAAGFAPKELQTGNGVWPVSYTHLCCRLLICSHRKTKKSKLFPAV